MKQSVNPWLWLLFAGLCEVVYAVLIPHAKSFTRILPSVVVVLFIAMSMFGLSMAMRSLPVGTAYAVWVGIGAGGTALVGLFFLNESRDLPRLIGISMIIGGIILLKVAHRIE